MKYAYIRVSTDRQNVENQRFEILEYSTKRGINIDNWVMETISATRSLETRKLGQLLKKLKPQDSIIVTEISRLGRNLLEIMAILNLCMQNDVKIFAIKEGYELGDNINSKVLAFAFGLSAEIERNLISQRTKEALARKRAEGVILGRPKGSSRPEHFKLFGKEETIGVFLEDKKSYSFIAKKLKVHRLTLAKYIAASPDLLATAKKARPRMIRLNQKSEK